MQEHKRGKSGFGPLNFFKNLLPYSLMERGGGGGSNQITAPGPTLFVSFSSSSTSSSSHLRQRIYSDVGVLVAISFLDGKGSGGGICVRGYSL